MIKVPEDRHHPGPAWLVAFDAFRINAGLVRIEKFMGRAFRVNGENRTRRRDWR
jgi:hypothetical protein